MKIKDLLSHFENQNQWVDIAHPILARITGTIKDLKTDEQVMNMEFHNWKLTSTNILQIDI